MKKVLIAALCVATLGLSSFTVKAPGVSFHIYGTEDFTQTLQLCNGDIVEFYFTVDYDYRGVENKNRINVHGTEHYTATGTDPVTGEVYTLNTPTRFTQNLPVLENGAIVVRNTFDEIITGNQGSLQKTFIRSSFVINANGELTSDIFVVETDCQ